MIWVNVHIPDKLCTTHKPTCGHVLQEETSLKGIREIRSDGGWYDFSLSWKRRLYGPRLIIRNTHLRNVVSASLKQKSDERRRENGKRFGI